MKIAVIIVNYQNTEETLACLRSIVDSQKTPLSIEYFLVDNGATRISKQKLLAQDPQIRKKFSRKNLGFAGGCNLAIKRALRAKADFVLLINPDSLVISRNFLSKLLAVGADITAPLIKYKKNTQTVYDFGGKVDYLFGHNTHFTSLSKNSTFPSPDYYTGACLLIKSDVFRKIGLLDDQYFLYYEDADFCLRASAARFSQKLCRSAILFHHLSTTTSKMGNRKISILAESHLRFCQKHIPIFSFPFYFSFNFYLRLKSWLP